MQKQAIERDLDLTEIINGEEIMAPSPFSKHQQIIINIYDAVKQYIVKNELGKLYFAPLDVILEDGINRLQPDLFFINATNLDIIKDWIRGVPDMVCEVISRRSYTKDTTIKKEIYEKYKIPEYWIVIPDLLAVEIYTIENDKYKIYTVANETGVVKSKVITGLEINITDIFND